MSEMNEKVIKALAETETDVEKEIEKKKMDLIKALLTSPSGDGDPVTTIAKYSMIKDLLADLKSKTSSDDKILGKVLTWAMVNQALQSTQPKQSIDPTTIMLLMNAMGKKSSGDEWIKFMQMYLQMQQQQYQQTQQLQQQLLTMLFGKQKSDIEELKERTEEMINRLNERIDMLMQSNASQQPGLKEYLQQMIEVRDTLKEAVEKLGVVEKAPEITDNKGKIQVGKLLERGLRLAEKIIEKAPLAPPQPKPVQMMPVQEQPPVQEVPTEQPKVEEEIKPLEQKLEQLEEKVEQMPKVEFNIPEPTPTEQQPKTEVKTEETKQEEVPAQVETIKEQETKESYEQSEQSEEISSESSQEQESSEKVDTTSTEEHKSE